MQQLRSFTLFWAKQHRGPIGKSGSRRLSCQFATQSADRRQEFVSHFFPTFFFLSTERSRTWINSKICKSPGVSHDIKMKWHHNERHRAEVHCSCSFIQSHKYAPGTISKMKTWKTLSGTSVMWFTQIVPGAMSTPSLNAECLLHRFSLSASGRLHLMKTVTLKFKPAYSRCFESNIFVA